MTMSAKDEKHYMKIQLVSVLHMSNMVEIGDGERTRVELLEELQSAIQDSSPIIRSFAADLMVVGGE
jgi:hypothetical protein